MPSLPFVFMSRKQFNRRITEATEHEYRRALADIVAILKKKDSIFLEPVSLSGEVISFSHNVVFGTGEGTAVCLKLLESQGKDDTKPSKRES